MEGLRKTTSEALALLPTSRNGLGNGALVYTPCEVGPKPRLPSTRKRDSVLPSTRRGGVLTNDANVRVLGLVLEALGPLKMAPKTASYKATMGGPRAPTTGFHLFYDAIVSWTIWRLHIYV